MTKSLKLELIHQPFHVIEKYQFI